MSAWTDEVLATALKLWADGESGSSIAQRLGLGLSRNAVIGRLYRAGAPKRVTATNLRWEGHVKRAPRGNRVCRVKPMPAPRPPRAQPKTAPKRDLSFARPWIERQGAQCAFPIERDGEIWSCCAPTGDVAETYCGPCRRIMFAPVQPRRLRL